jgi:hypothetical protein
MLEAQRWAQACILLLAIMLLPQRSAADFVRLEALVEAPAARLAGKLQHAKTVVAVRNGMQVMEPWDIPDAVAVELVAALRRRGLDAILAASDVRFEKLESADQAFTVNQAEALELLDRDALVGIELLTGSKPRLRLTAYASQARKPLATEIIDVPPDALLQDNNIPPANREIVEFARKSLDTKVREGDCTQLAEDSLKAAGKTKRGIYRWGRELEPREPWLPGDILQMERLTVKAPGFFRDLGHHTAIVEEAHRDRVVVLHQNAFPKGQVVQRETWPIKAIRGSLVAYRPWDWPKHNPFPPASPLRKISPLSSRSPLSKELDLLKIVDPRLDRVQGIWFFERGGLRSPVEFEARLQIPVAPPPSYRLSMTVERLQGEEMLGLGVMVGGHQTLLAIACFKSTTVGIHNLDGKPANENESTQIGSFLPLYNQVLLECRVRPDSLALDLDGESVIDWRGDPSRLTVSPDWPVPNDRWLFLGAFASEFDIQSFTLEPLE